MDDLLARLRDLPCGARLVDAAAGLPAFLVGGAVRDLLLGRVPRELDVAVQGEVGPLARRLGGAATAHERFGTASVRDGDCRFDLAATRGETYARPGALPDVHAAGIEEDLRRRDVTVNALALGLADGRLVQVPGALEDLRAGRLRVLHDASFRDDPTRLWRMARYAARLGMTPEPHTARLAAEAVAAGALDTVSDARLAGELRLALAEPDPVAALEAAVALGLAPWLAPDRDRAQAALELLPADEGRADLVVLASALTGERPPERLDLTAAERETVRAAAGAPALAAALAGAQRPSQSAAVLRGRPVEAVALAGAHGAGPQARRWLDELRHVRLDIGGDDLLAAGVAAGPDLGRRLARTLERRLDGELGPGREAQLRAALDGA